MKPIYAYNEQIQWCATPTSDLEGVSYLLKVGVAGGDLRGECGDKLQATPQGSQHLSLQATYHSERQSWAGDNHMNIM